MAIQLSKIFQEKYHNNILPLLSQEEIDDVARQVKLAFQLDQESNGEKIRQLQEIVDLAMTISEQKTYPWEGAANAIYPLIAQAAIEFGASLYPQLIQDGQVVKPKIVGNDEGKPVLVNGEEQKGEDGKIVMQDVGVKLEKGKRICQYMNYQFMEQMYWWETDMDKLVHTLPVLGTLFKKVYYDPLKKMCVSELIFPDKLIINNNARDIEEAIITEIQSYYPQEIQQKIRNGIYIKYDFDPKQKSVNSDIENSTSLKTDPSTVGDNLRRFITQRNWFDLDDDGFLEPYSVTIDLSRDVVVRMIPCFDEDGIEYNDKDEVKAIHKNQHYLVYRFLPSPDGSFWGMGFGHLLYNLNNVTNTTLNQLIDSGTLANNGGGFIGKGLNIKGGRLSMSKMEWKLVDNFGASLKDNIVPFPTPQPSAVLLELLSFLVDAGKSLSSLRDILTGDVAGSIAPTIYMGMMEQGLKQYKSIYKRIYKSLKDEYGKVRDCDEKYVTNDEYAEILNMDPKEVSAKRDFDDKAHSVIPVADPSAITSIQKLGQAQFVQGLMQDPFYDPIKLRRILNASVEISGLEEALRTPPEKPDPTLLLAQAEMTKAQAKQAEVELSGHKLNVFITEVKYKIENMLADVEVKKSTVLKNLAEAEVKQKEHNLSALTAAAEAQTNRIQVEAGIKAAQDDNELKKQELEHNMLLAQQDAQAEQAAAPPESAPVS